jgi:predicted ATPase/class 3 adenylate cyclase
MEALRHHAAGYDGDRALRMPFGRHWPILAFNATGGFAVAEQPAVTTFFFTDIEGSSRLWETQPERMQPALVRHDQILREAVLRHRGQVVKTTGDGVHAVFDDPHDAVRAAVAAQTTLADPGATAGLELRVRCGMHAGIANQIDNDYFGSAVNRAARIMSAAHGGQVLLSQTVADLLRGRLPDGVSLRDLGAVRLRDLAGAERLYQVLHAALRVDFPALRSLEAVPNNLPQQVTTFVGREREIAEVKEALARTRLLTLCGIGGLGKTRLSLQVAADVVNHYPDGVWFVELAAITDPRRVPHAVAAMLGVKEETGGSVVDALVKHARDARLLLVLDNCEHVLAACAELAHALLQSSAHVRILASSRERFNIAGELVHTVPPLAVPAPGDRIAADAILQCEAVRLFVERATAAQATFRVTDENAPAIVEICRRLDGIPLALELAAARVRALTVERIAARVTDRFRLLTTGDRAALPRQQTLRAMIDWSHDLLTENERALFRRVAVFAGGFALEAAEAVARGGDIGEPDVLDLLAALVEKSLVMMPADGGRYALLETVRQYAEERLAASNEETDVRSRHLAFYLAFAEAAAKGLAGDEQADWLRRLDADRENLLTAHAWSVRSRIDPESGYRLVGAIKLYWFIRGLLDLGRRVTVEALSVEDGGRASLAHCRALWAAGQICAYTGRYEEGQRYLQQSLALARELGDRRMIAAVQNFLALAALGLGDRGGARRHCEEALDLARELGDEREIAVASNALAQLHRMDSNLDAAEPLYEQVVTFAHAVRDREFAAVGILGLAMVAVGRGNARRASALLDEVVAIADETGSTPAAQSALDVGAGLAALLDDFECSARFYGATKAQTERTAIRRDPADEAFLQPLIARARAALGDAAFARAEAAGRALTFDAAQDELRAWLAARG